MTRICLRIFISFRLDHIFKNGVSGEEVEGRCAQKVLMGMKCFITHPCHWMSVTNLGWTRSLFQALVIPVTLPSHFYLR